MSENRSTWLVAAGIPFFYPSIRALGVCRVAWPMWVVRECEGCPICLRESFGELGSRWKRFPVETNSGAGIAVLSQVALERALTTRVRVIASVGDSRS